MLDRLDNSLRSAVLAMRLRSRSPVRGSLYLRFVLPVRVPERSYMFSRERSRAGVCESVPEASLSTPAGAYLPSHYRSAGCLQILEPMLSPRRSAAPTPQIPVPCLAARTVPHLV